MLDIYNSCCSTSTTITDNRWLFSSFEICATVAIKTDIPHEVRLQISRKILTYLNLRSIRPWGEIIKIFK